MSKDLKISQIASDQFEPALTLLIRFMDEEAFRTAADEIAANLKAMLAHPATAVFLGWQDEAAVAVATARYSPSIEHGYYAELEDLYVLPEARGQGVARTLIDYVCDWCRERNCSRLEVCITSEGEELHSLTAFYARHGFTATGRDLLYRPLGPTD